MKKFTKALTVAAFSFMTFGLAHNLSASAKVSEPQEAQKLVLENVKEADTGNVETVNITLASLSSIRYDTGGYIYFTLNSVNNIPHCSGWADFNKPGLYADNGVTITKVGKAPYTTRLNYWKQYEGMTKNTVKSNYGFNFQSWSGGFQTFSTGDKIKFDATITHTLTNLTVKVVFDFEVELDAGLNVTPVGGMPETLVDLSDDATLVNQGSHKTTDASNSQAAVLYYGVPEHGAFLTAGDWGNAYRATGACTLVRDGVSTPLNMLIVYLDTKAEGLQYCFYFETWYAGSVPLWDVNGDGYTTSGEGGFKDGDILQIHVKFSSSGSFTEPRLTIYIEKTLYYTTKHGINTPWVTEADLVPGRALLEEINNFGTVTLDSYDAIQALQSKYVDLDVRVRNVLTELKEGLDALEAQYISLVYENEAAPVIAAIEAIGTVTIDSYDSIVAARTAYDALSEGAKGKVGALVDTLVAAEAQVKLLRDTAAAENVKALIEAIGTVELTEDSLSKIDAARTAYDALNPEAKALVSSDLVDILVAAETTYLSIRNTSKAKEVEDLIDAIGNVNETETCWARIKAARDAYAQLNNDARALVAPEKVQVLEAALDAYNAILTQAITAGLAQIDTIANAVDFTLYTKVNAEKINKLIRDAKQAVNNAETKAEINSLVSKLRNDIAKIAVIEVETESTGGCGGSVIAASALLSTVALAGFGMMLLRRKQK